MGWYEPRNTRKARKGNSEPRMDTKYTKGKFRTTNGHEWTRMENSEPRVDTNGAKGKFRTTNGHEWTRMDTNGTTKYRSGTTKNTKYTKGKYRTTNGHE